MQGKLDTLIPYLITDKYCVRIDYLTDWGCFVENGLWVSLDSELRVNDQLTGFVENRLWV